MMKEKTNLEMISPFKNDPFCLVYQAYRNLYSKPFEAFFDQHIDNDGEAHENEYGYTHFLDDGSIPTIIIFAEHNVNIQIETFAHELAHVAVGVEHDHDDVWEKAFDAIFLEYNRIGDEMFSVEEDDHA